ncbi:MAG TPA: F0F1 ATP synthase subunit B [Stellaceae bacterium]|nr:F0F1 ATP synthase subunit B [Stellaceae bacterium]
MPHFYSFLPHFFAEPEFFVLIAFGIFIAVAWKRGAQAVAASLDARSARIREELNAAQNLREEAERALAEYQTKQREAAAEAEAIVAHARAEAERTAAQAARDLELTLERRRRLAEERIAQEQQKALAEIRALAVDLAVAAARQVIAGEVDEARGAALIDGEIAALPPRLH